MTDHGGSGEAGSGDRRTGDRRASERRSETARSDKTGAVPGHDLTTRVTQVESELVDDPASPAASGSTSAAPSGPEAAFAAQVIGQGGQRNGIRGGPPVMDRARSTYLGAEYSGDQERRPPVGQTKRTDV